MEEIKIERAKKKDWPYIREKLKNYILDATDTHWKRFFVAKNNNKTVAFGRIKDYGEYFEIASIGVDYYHRGKGIGTKMILFLVDEAKRINPGKQIYGISHRPNFLKKAGFEEISSAPEALEHKKKTTCKFDPANSRIMEA
jgi:N-acetylglutamate synthase-like GNAT family acetyltransferase